MHGLMVVRVRECACMCECVCVRVSVSVCVELGEVHIVVHPPITVSGACACVSVRVCV